MQLGAAGGLPAQVHTLTPVIAVPEQPVAAPWAPRWLFKAETSDWQMWHKLCLMMFDSMHATGETSYLSLKKVRRPLTIPEQPCLPWRAQPQQPSTILRAKWVATDHELTRLK